MCFHLGLCRYMCQAHFLSKPSVCLCLLAYTILVERAEVCHWRAEILGGDTIRVNRIYADKNGMRSNCGCCFEEHTVPKFATSLLMALDKSFHNWSLGFSHLQNEGIGPVFSKVFSRQNSLNFYWNPLLFVILSMTLGWVPLNGTDRANLFLILTITAGKLLIFDRILLLHSSIT